MKKITIILLFAFFASFLNAQIHPITGILPAPDAKYMLISVDTFSADRMNYDSIWFSIVGDSLHLTNDIAINASTLVNTNIDTTNTIVTITALLDTLQGFRDTLTTGSTSLWTDAGSETYLTSTSDNVGIGITSPIQRLHIHATGGAGVGIAVTNSTTGSTVSDGAFFGLAGDESLIFNQRDAYDLKFATTNTVRAQILSTGEMGVGTTTPTARFQIKGAAATSATDAFIVENSASTTLLHIEDGGNIGIGTATPDALLEVESATTANIKIGDGTDKWEFSHATGDGNLVLSTSDDKSFIIEDAGGSEIGVFNALSGDFQTYSAQIHNGTDYKNALAKTSTGSGLRLGSATSGDWNRIYITHPTVIGSSTIDGSAALEVVSTTQGVRFPNMTSTQRNAITAVAGLTIFNTTTSKLETYDGSTWNAHW